MKILSILLLLTSAALSVKHGADAVRPPTAQSLKMMTNLGIPRSGIPAIGLLSVAIGIMLFFRPTFLPANILNAILILLIMALSLHAGDWKTALIEIPFLALPLILIGLKYPFKG